MIRSVFAATFAAALLAGPAIALAQTDMVTYGDTLRKKSPGTHSALHQVQRGTVSAKHGASGARHPAAKARHHK
jgi:hypothetical protein